MRLEAEQRIRERVRALGQPSIEEYLAARPGVPYSELADELGGGVLGLHIAALLPAAAASPEILDRLWHELKARAQPGWLPETPSDATVVAAFDAAWKRP
jgi:hypothetical protein